MPESLDQNCLHLTSYNILKQAIILTYTWETPIYSCTCTLKHTKNGFVKKVRPANLALCV